MTWVTRSINGAYDVSPGSTPAWIAAQPLNTWFQFPNSVITSIGASQGIMNDFSGTVLANGYLYAFGGGHGGATDNTVARYNIAQGTGWEIFCTSTPVVQRNYAVTGDTDPAKFMWGDQGNLKPNPPHTYASGQWIPELNRIHWFGQRAPYHYSGSIGANDRMLQLKLDTATWIQPGSSEDVMTPPFGRCTIRIPSMGKVLGDGGSTILIYDPLLAPGSQFSVWTTNNILSGSGYWHYMHDEAGNRLIRIGNAYSGERLVGINLTTKAVTILSGLLNGTQSILDRLNQIMAEDTIGACIDPINNRIVVPDFAAGGLCHMIDLTTYTVTDVQPPIAAGTTVMGANGSGGYYDKVHYYPLLKMIVFSPNGYGSTVGMRLGATPAKSTVARDTYYSVPSGSKIFAGKAADVPTYLTGMAVGQVKGIAGTAATAGNLDSFCGWAYDSTTRRLIYGASGGGTSGGADNSVNTMDLGKNSPTWVQIKAASAGGQVSNGNPINLDGSPNAVQTNAYTHWVPGRGLVILGSVAPSAGTSSFDNCHAFAPNTWSPGAGTWAPAGQIESCVGGRYGNARMPNGDVWALWGTNGSRYWSALTGTWSNPGTTGTTTFVRYPWAYNPKRVQHYGLTIGDGQGVGTDIRSVMMIGNVMTDIALSGSGYTQFQADAAIAQYPAMVYDVPNDRFLWYCGLGSSVGRIYAITPNYTTTWDITVLATTGDSLPVTVGGMLNKMTYVDFGTFKGVVMMPAKAGGIYFLRTA